MDFYSKVQDELSTQKSITTNGAVAYASSGKNLLDFNFGVTGMRNQDEKTIQKNFKKVYLEDKLHALEDLFYIGDIRGGLGERKVFRAGLSYLAENQPKIAEAVMDLIPYYNRWDSILGYLDCDGTREKAA